MVKRNVINAVVLDTQNPNARATAFILIAQVQIEIGLVHAIATTTADIKIDVIIAMMTNYEIIKGAMFREIETGTLIETAAVEKTIENKIIREETVPVLKIATEMIDETTGLIPANAAETFSATDLLIRTRATITS